MQIEKKLHETWQSKKADCCPNILVVSFHFKILFFSKKNWRKLPKAKEKGFFILRADRVKTSRRAEHLPFLNALAFKNEGLFSEIKLYRLHFRYELQQEAKGLTVLAAFVAKPGGGSQITGVALCDTVAWILRVWHQNLPGQSGQTWPGQNHHR